MNNKKNLPNALKRRELESEIRFEGGISRQMMSGVKRLTIRLGNRKFTKNIIIHGYPAVVERTWNTTLLHMDFLILSQQGFKNMFSTLMILRRFYPDINMNSEITIVEYRVLPY
jgi:hypothetical protein